MIKLPQGLYPARTHNDSWRLPVLRYCSVPESSLATAARDSVPMCRLSEQLAFLRRRGWRLLGLTEALSYVRSGGTERVAALTFDGGLLDFLNAWRVLNDIGARTTLYVPVDSVGVRVSRWDRGFSRLGWEQLGTLAEEGIELGSQWVKPSGPGDGNVVDRLAVDKECLQIRANSKVSSIGIAIKRRVSSELCHALARAGYDTACTLRRGVARSGEQQFALPRISIDMHASGEAIHELIRQDKPAFRLVV